MKISVLLCTYNRHELLRTALRALVEKTTEKPDQVVVVNGGGPEADRVVESFQGRGVEVLLVKTKNVNLAASRNIGLPRCGGDIVAMTDDDAEVFPDWLTRLKAAYAKYPDAGAVGGAVHGADSGSFIDELAGVSTFPVHDGPRSVRTLPGVNISYKREAVLRLGPQNETLFRGEDVEYNWRLIRLGYKIYYEPSAKVLHHNRPGLRPFIHQQYMYGRAYYLVRRLWPDMYCVYPHEIRSLRDALKAVNFTASLFYQPFLNSRRMSTWGRRLLSWPVFFALGLAWKGGMIQEALHRKNV